jgi:hypothetical protein
MELKCLNDIIYQGLAIHIDLTDSKSWNLNNEFTSISLNQWKNAKSDSIFLYDFGLTAFDNGRVSKMYDTLTLTPNDTKVQLYRVGYNTETGGTFYDGYGITGVTENGYVYGSELTGITANTVFTGDTFVGSHFNLRGGYLQGFFKLYNYNHELFPARSNGITIETVVRVDENSFNDGIIFMMGARSEDKYNDPFSGETQLLSTYKTKIQNKETIEYLDASNSYSGVTTGEGNYLAGYKTGTTVPNAVKSMDSMDNEIYIRQNKTSINGNVIALYLTSDEYLGFKYIDDSGIVRNQISSNKIGTGWTIITLTFKPYEIITDPDLLECAERRKGDFAVYVNGRQMWKIKDFDEFYFKNIKNQKEKQLGVPYNISWGGGSFGLKHSYHWDINKRTLYDGNDQQFINDNFKLDLNPLADYSCIVTTGMTGTSATTGIQFTMNDTLFYTDDICDPQIQLPVTVMEVKNVTGITSTKSSYYIEHTTPFELLSNRDYTAAVKIFDTGIFQNRNNSSQLPTSKKISLVVYGTTDINIIEEVQYDGTKPNQWNDLSLKFRLKDNTGLQTIFIGLYIESDQPLVDGFRLFIDNFTLVGSDKLSKDKTKDGLVIENNFNNSFFGGIQKLRIYDYGFTSEQVLHNAYFESKNNPNLNIKVSKGGRVIYR